MSTPVVMPQMGESIAEGTIVRWIKKVGDSIDRDEPLFEISTDKVDAEIPSPAAGVLLQIRVNEGETGPVDSVVGLIGAAGEAVAAGEATGTGAADPVGAAATAPAPVAAVTRAGAPGGYGGVHLGGDAARAVHQALGLLGGSAALENGVATVPPVPVPEQAHVLEVDVSVGPIVRDPVVVNGAAGHMNLFAIAAREGSHIARRKMRELCCRLKTCDLMT